MSLKLFTTISTKTKKIKNEKIIYAKYLSIVREKLHLQKLMPELI